jgi:hypothetical protein
MCNITFTSMELNSAGTQLTVTGTSDCQTIVVSLPSYSQQVSVPVVGGSWTAVFTSADADLVKLRAECGKDVKIDAFCKEDETCINHNHLVLKCGDDPPTDNCCTMICCMVFKLLFLLGLGFGLLGWILNFCPGGICGGEAESHIIYGLRVWGAVLALIGLLFWIVLCRPKQCEWIAALWQFLILAGLLMIYAGFCPECLRLLYYGLGLLVLGLALYFWWIRKCHVNICQRLSEWAGLFLIPVNVLLALLAILANCASANRTGAYIIIGLSLLFQLWLLTQLKKYKCIKC